jgi:peptide/nickel transport system ATP-binding protein
MEELLRVENLSASFAADYGEVTAVDGVSFSISRGATLGLVGESGCGKSVTALSIMGLLAKTAIIESGKIMFRGENLLEKSVDEMCDIRGNRISMIFQEPMTSLNPVLTIGNQLMEAITTHQDVSSE